MKTDYKYYEIDKAMSKKIAEEFKGKEWEVDCDTCKGEGFYYTPYFKIKKKWKCKSCNGKGKYLMTY